MFQHFYNMDHYGQNHLFFYQDFLFATQSDGLKNLLIKLRSLEKQRLSFLKDQKDYCFFDGQESENTIVYILLYKIYFHLFYLKLRQDKNEKAIRIEMEIYHEVKTYIYLYQVEVPILLFTHYCLKKASGPLNDLLLSVVKLIMTVIYFLVGWTGLIKKCIR